jgi:hypothetical protein
MRPSGLVVLLFFVFANRPMPASAPRWVKIGPGYDIVWGGIFVS